MLKLQGRKTSRDCGRFGFARGQVGLILFFLFCQLELANELKRSLIDGAFTLGFFLALDAKRGPRHSQESLFIDVHAALHAFAILSPIHSLQRFLDLLEALKVTFMEVI